MIPEPRQGRGLTGWIRRVFTENIGLKLISITAAVVLFSLVHGAEDAQRSVFIDVVAILPSQESGKVLISELPDRVKVTMQGSRSLLNSIRSEEFRAVEVDLSDPDLRYYYFDPASIEVPAGVTIVQLAPASIPLTWADRVERRFPVAVQLTGELAEGLSIHRPVEVDPDTVVLKGAQNELDPLAAIQTEPIDVTGLGPGRHERRVRLMGAPPHATYEEETSVSTLLEVVPEVEQRTMAGLELEVLGPMGRVRPRSVAVLLEGPPRPLAQLADEQVVPWVDARDPTLVGTVPARVQLRGIPDEITVVSIDPDEVLLTVMRHSPGPGAAGGRAGTPAPEAGGGPTDAPPPPSAP